MCECTNSRKRVARGHDVIPMEIDVAEDDIGLPEASEAVFFRVLHFNPWRMKTVKVGLISGRVRPDDLAVTLHQASPGPVVCAEASSQGILS